MRLPFPAWPQGYQPDREWIYRQAFPLGRHIIGYEVQKVLAAVDFLETRELKAESRKRKVGVAGYGEGGLIGFYAAALDQRIDAALVSGYCDSRQRLWEEPIYRNAFGLLREFGDAEIASLIALRILIVEHSIGPQVNGPPAVRQGRSGAAPGRLRPPDYSSVEAEFERARALLKTGDPKVFDRLKLITGTEGMTTGPGSDRALAALLEALGTGGADMRQPGQAPAELRVAFDAGARQQRQAKELEEYTQALFHQLAQGTSCLATLRASIPPGWTNWGPASRKAHRAPPKGMVEREALSKCNPALARQQ